MCMLSVLHTVKYPRIDVFEGMKTTVDTCFSQVSSLVSTTFKNFIDICLVVQVGIFPARN